MDEHLAVCSVCKKRFEQMDGESECSYVCRAVLLEIGKRGKNTMKRLNLFILLIALPFYVWFCTWTIIEQDIRHKENRLSLASLEYSTTALDHSTRELDHSTRELEKIVNEYYR